MASGHLHAAVKISHVTVRSWLVLAALAVTGFVAVGAARDVTDDFWLGLWLNVGTSCFLFGAFYLVERLILERRVTEAAKALREAVTDEIETLRSDFAGSIYDLQEHMDALTEARDEADRNLVDSFIAQPTAGTLQRLLLRALSLGAISPRGVRVEVPHQYERLRFGLGDGGEVQVAIEQFDGETIETIPWTDDLDVGAIFNLVATALQRRRLYPGDSSFDVPRMLQQVSDSIALGLDARIGRGGGALDLGPVIEVPNASWAITEDGIEALAPHHYVIERHRVDEADLYSHLAGKGWTDRDEVHWTLTIARALFGRDRNESVDASD